MSLKRLLARLASFPRSNRGTIAIQFALALPALALAVAGAADLVAVHAAKQRLEDIGDAAALAGAKELGLAITDKAAIERAEAFVDEQLAQWGRAPTVTQTITVEEIDGQRVLAVKLNGNRVSFFVNLLPPGGWNFEVVSHATSIGRTPLCVLGIGDAGQTVISVADSSRLSAPECMVHSNRDVVANGAISAGAVQAVTRATGSITPKAGVGAAMIEDPFTGLALDENQACGGATSVTVLSSGTEWLTPGVHCGSYKLKGDARLFLQPGEHWFLGGHLDLSDNAMLEGDDVVLFFDKQSKFDFTGNSVVRLDGRRTGAYAGMVVAATRGNTQRFLMSSDNVEKLLGVIYVPQATLVVDGHAEVARDSAWTVIVARWIELRGSASLVINADYDGSIVPVPDGVGPNAGGVRLIK
jgi:hypothetical protein